MINSLFENGLQIEFLHEFLFGVYDVFPNSTKGKDGWWRINGFEDIIQMMFSIKERKWKNIIL